MVAALHGDDTMTTNIIAATLYGAKDLRVVEHQLAPLADDMVRVAFGAGGVCGSDMHYFSHGRTGDFVVRSPLILGHEVAGTVVEAGRSVRGVSVGERVAVNPSRWCGSCSYCRAGASELVREHLLHGFGVEDAAYAGRICFAIRRNACAMRQGAGTCVISIGGAGRTARGLPACRQPRAGPRGRTGLFIGAGPIGLLTMIAARQAALKRADRRRYCAGAAWRSRRVSARMRRSM